MLKHLHFEHLQCSLHARNSFIIRSFDSPQYSDGYTASPRPPTLPPPTSPARGPHERHGLRRRHPLLHREGRHNTILKAFTARSASRTVRGQRSPSPDSPTGRTPSLSGSSTRPSTLSGSVRPLLSVRVVHERFASELKDEIALCLAAL